MIRSALGNWFMAVGRKLARADGRELAVDLSNHSISLAMVPPVSSNDRAWDADLYQHGNVFLKGYANPIKPTVSRNKELEQPDTVSVKQPSETETGVATDGGTEDPESHVEMISSDRYGTYMKQDLIRQLLNPEEQWKKIVYAVIGLGGVMLLNFVVTLSAAGAF